MNPKTGDKSDGITRVAKIKPAPVEFQWNVRFTKSGKAPSKAPREHAWTKHPNSETRMRGIKRRRIIVGTRVTGLGAVVSFSDSEGRTELSMCGTG